MAGLPGITTLSPTIPPNVRRRGDIGDNPLDQLRERDFPIPATDTLRRLELRARSWTEGGGDAPDMAPFFGRFRTSFEYSS